MPVRRWRYACSFQDPSDGRDTHPVSELEQLALNPLAAPVVVLGGHPFDQPCDRLVNWRTSVPVWVGPLHGYQAPVPAQDRFRHDQPVRSQRLGSRRTNAANTARSTQSRRGFGLPLRSTAASWRSTSNSTFLDADERPGNTSRPTKPEEDQIAQTQRHGWRSGLARHVSVATGRMRGPTSGTPQVKTSDLLLDRTGVINEYQRAA